MDGAEQRKRVAEGCEEDKRKEKSSGYFEEV